MTRRSSVIVASLVLAVAAAGLAAPLLVRHVAVARALDAGVEIDVDRVRLTPSGVWLVGVQARLPKLPSVTVTLNAVHVRRMGLWGIESIGATGGAVRVTGDVDEFVDQVRAFAEARRRGGGSGGAPGPSLEVHGLDIDWRGAGGSSAHAWGVRFERDGGREAVGMDLARVAVERGSFELSGLEVALRHVDGRRVLDELSAGRVVATLQLGNLEQALAGADPAVAPAVAGDAGDPLDAGRGARLRAALTAATDIIGDAMVPGGQVTIAGLSLVLRTKRDVLTIGPGRMQLGRDAARVRVGYTPSEAAQDGELKLEVDAPIGPGPAHVAVAGGPLFLSQLGVRAGSFGLLDVDRTSLRVQGRATLDETFSEVRFDGDFGLDELSLRHDKLAKTPVRGLALFASARGAVRVDGSRLSITHAELGIGKARLNIEGTVDRNRDRVRVEATAKVPLAACQAVFDSIPPALLPLLQGARLEGTFSGRARLALDSDRPGDAEVELSVDNRCLVTEVPERIHPGQFTRAFIRKVLNKKGEVVSLESGPGSAGWVPLHAVSRHMETALLVCEDSRFWTHAGFDEKAIHSSIRDNLKAGRFVRGASTLSMQLAKNLYLERDKTVSRKLQEAWLTMLIEQQRQKFELLELYMNVVEYGPGVYGIGPAAQHYFNTKPADLSLGQALYLGSILPNPSRQHFDEQGRVTEKWSEYLRRLMRIAKKIDRITDEELEAGLAEQVAFGVPSVPGVPGETGRSSPGVGEAGEDLEGATPDELTTSDPAPGAL